MLAVNADLSLPEISMPRFALACASIALLSSAVFAAEAEGPVRLRLDQPETVNGVEAACTGIGTESREDPRWGAYPLRVETAGQGGQLLGDVQLTVLKAGQPLLSVRCNGPWLLLRLAPGAYRIAGEFETRMAAANANVPARGQGRVTLRFPNAGGSISPEYVPPGTPARPDASVPQPTTPHATAP
jgi:hypothetical protein